jgi:hypothetical protein
LWETGGMPERELRFVKETPNQTIGVCSYCNKQFKSHLRVTFWRLQLKAIPPARKANQLWCEGCERCKFASLFTEAQKKQTGGLIPLPVGSKVEHKTEHNNCRMRGPESESEASVPTVSS